MSFSTVLLLAVVVVGVCVALSIADSFLGTKRCASCRYYRPHEYMTTITLDDGKTVYVCENTETCLKKSGML